MAAAALAAAGWGGAARAHVPPSGNWSLAFADEFNGSSLDTMKWNYNYPWSQHGLADDSVEQASQVTVGNGVMNLTAIAQGQWYNNNWYDYTSGAVNTQGKLNFTYGYIEASQKMPSQQGTWPAFWMLQNGWPPEIDIQEVPAFGSNPTSYSSGYHYSNAAGAASSAGPGIVNEGTNLSAGFNTYGVNWQPTSLTFYFNGNVVGSVSGSSANIAQAAQQYLLIDLGVGGWPGNPPAGTPFPAVMQTDWVRVWQQLPGGAATNSTTWGKAAGGNWDDSAGWNNGVPALSATTAAFANLPGSPAAATINWSGSRSVNGLTFVSTTAYTLAATANGGAGLLLAPADGVPLAAESVTISAAPIGGVQAAPTINARVEVPYALETLVVSNTTTSPLLFNGDLIGPGALSVAAGPVNVNGNDQMTGPVSIAGGSALTVNGKVSAASQFLVANGSVRANPGSTVTANSWFSVGSTAGGTGRLTIAGGAVSAAADFNVGDVSGSAGSLTLSGGTLAVQTFYLGKSGTATGTFTQSAGAVTTLPGAGDWRIGGAASPADAAAVGLYNLSGGTFADAGNLQVGGYGHGTVAQTGGTATVGNYLAIGRYPGGVGVYNLSAGTGVLTAAAGPTLIVGEQGTGTLLVGGSSVVNAQSLTLGYAAGGTGTVNQSGGTVNTTAGVVIGSVGSGTYNLAGGVLVAPAVSRGTGSGTLYLNGGTLRASAAAPSLIAGLTAARVGVGGAVFDTNGYAAAVPQTLVPDPALDGKVDGGLTKLGIGTLTLAAADTYAGPTTVAAGTLALAPTGSVSNSAVTVAAGATVSLAAPSTTALLVRRFAGLTIAGSAAIAPATAGRTLLVTPSLTLAGGSLDVANNDLDLPGGNLAVVSALVTGRSIYSSVAAADPSHLHAVAVIANDDGTGNPLFGVGGPLGAFDGTSPADGDVLVRYTYVGDANLDGLVNGADYVRLDAGYAAASTATPLAGWYNGDFNGDGVVDGSDYTLIDNAFNLHPSPAVPLGVAVITSEVAAVPEPATAAGLSVIAAASLARRRRRANG